MRLLCLLPVRNGAEDLRSYFASVALFADAVVALDDGSTDDTYERLKAEPCVCEILRNPPRDSYVGWDDSMNRRHLLQAAAKFRPEWIFWLDADEVLEPSDAEALQPFLQTEARRDVAYAVEVYRMIEDMSHYDKSNLWVYRFYSYSPTHTLSQNKLHFDLVPLEFRPEKRVRTTLRILHRASLTEQRRSARFDKYRLCDPDNMWQPSYQNLLDTPRNVKVLKRRAVGTPVILAQVE